MPRALTRMRGGSVPKGVSPAVARWHLWSRFTPLLRERSAPSAIRSNRVTHGLATERRSMASWCRSKAILREQRPARAKDIRHGGGEHEHGFEHGRAKLASKPLRFPADPRSSQDGGLA